jgi:hypothetical protein
MMLSSHISCRRDVTRYQAFHAFRHFRFADTHADSFSLLSPLQVFRFAIHFTAFTYAGHGYGFAHFSPSLIFTPDRRATRHAFS